MRFIVGDINTLLKYETAAQRRNIPIMLGINGIQKVYGSNNNLIPPAVTSLVRNMGLTFCQSATLMKVCVCCLKLMHYYLYKLLILFLFSNRKY